MRFGTATTLTPALQTTGGPNDRAGWPTSRSSEFGFDGFERLAGLVAPRLRYRPVVEVFPEFPLLLQVDNDRSSRTAVVYEVLDSSDHRL